MLSIFDLFKIDIVPSGSHTVGPMWAANRYLLELDFHGLVGRVAQIQAHLLRFEAFDVSRTPLLEGIYYSVGGDFVLSDAEIEAGADKVGTNVVLPYPFNSAAELLEIGETNRLSVAETALANENVWRDEEEIR